MLPRWLILICFCIFLQWNVDSSSAKKLDVVHEWKYFDYDFGSEKKRDEAIKSGEYNYKSMAPIDVDKWKDLTFVTVIRAKGVPASLNIVTDKLGPGGPLLKPYPDWSWAKLGNCDSITSVYRVAIDKCDRLWVLDNGKVDDNPICDPQLLAFDLNTSKLLKRIKIPEKIAVNATTGKGLLVTPVVDTRGEYCQNTIVYVADVDGYALIYYDDRRHFFKRLTSSAFNYDPKYTKFTIEGESFTLQDGIVGMALSQQTGNLYFTPMSSHTIGFVQTNILKRSMGESLKVTTYDNILYTQESAKAMSKSGILFSGRVSDTSIGCWYERKPRTKEYVGTVAKDPVTLQFTSGMKVKQGSCEELYVLTNRHQKIVGGTLNYNEPNFRILKGSVKKLVQGTVCEPYREIPVFPPIWPWLFGPGPRVPF
ncbi:major royal jelly protein 1-like [Ceratina calcarata]|uniref:Major royal jelly protein 1-like n=1 Tax=Ceratina calcarata TaxID=156304 RepID=A0AAJ7NBY9_9HYME|nr:major royal jelly protein 1-like [Ceratina calcarata]